MLGMWEVSKSTKERAFKFKKIKKIGKWNPASNGEEGPVGDVESTEAKRTQLCALWVEATGEKEAKGVRIQVEHIQSQMRQIGKGLDNQLEGRVDKPLERDLEMGGFG